VISIFARGSDPFTWEGHDPSGHNRTFSYAGPSMHLLKSNLKWDFSKHSKACGEGGCSYSKVFKVIFPALTGIMAGSNMSGVLRRPELAIPRGELSAIAGSMLTYLIVIISLGASVPRDTLKNEYQILSVVTYPGTGPSVIVIIGVIASTTSSALASIQSASRVMQALASDNLIPILSVFKRECNGEPVAGILCSVAISMALLCVGSLDAIAPVLTMFFLLTYMTTNAACFVHRVSGHPNFRPRFRYFSWHTALFGGLLCLLVMFFLNWYYTIIAIGFMASLVTYISRRKPTAGSAAGPVPGSAWGDVGQSLMFHQVRKFLLRIDERKSHVKFWRPQFMVVLYGGPCDNVPALEFINNVKKGGLFVIGDTITVPGDSDPDADVFQKAVAR
jgi:potassium/chloride transporter 9